MDPGINRAEQLYVAWEQRRKELERVMGTSLDARKMQELKYSFFLKGLFRVSAKANEQERLYIQVLKVIVLKLRKVLYPSPVLRFLIALKERVLDGPLHLRGFGIRKEENIVSLSQQLSEQGLGGLAADLSVKLDYERQGVSLEMLRGISTGEKLAVEASFLKEGLGQYRFTGFQARLMAIDGNVRECFFSAESRLNLSQALKLLHGGSILKSNQGLDGQWEQSWVKLEQQPGHAELSLLVSSNVMAGFDLKKQLLDHAIALECYAISSDTVLRELESGSMVAISMTGKDKFYIRAGPFENRLEFFDANKKEIAFDKLKSQLVPNQVASVKEVSLFGQDIGNDKQLEISR
ncbi:hypothetical protein [Pedobacter miscanthi]|uniref:Uncharacterized protein n=1 Tax=Pedobacter miscanthi TaxID=2259170 RepID=A0A366KZX5_9SPHI|nr:hypothetical protein [Pedobacter miscanthi]RBQ06793.1 hypothetical protein DRW42_13555 [Pedobacter miscanthi]